MDTFNNFQWGWRLLWPHPRGHWGKAQCPGIMGKQTSQRQWMRCCLFGWVQVEWSIWRKKPSFQESPSTTACTTKIVTKQTRWLNGIGWYILKGVGICLWLPWCFQIIEEKNHNFLTIRCSHPSQSMRKVYLSMNEILSLKMRAGQMKQLCQSFGISSWSRAPCSACTLPNSRKKTIIFELWGLCERQKTLNKVKWCIM